MPKPESVVYARESVLVDAQCLIQTALNDKYGNPRDYEDTNPDKTQDLFDYQRIRLADEMGISERRVSSLLADDARINIKDLAECLHVMGYELNLSITKIKD